MVRKAFVMKVYPNKQLEYEKRHNKIWPEMVEELHKHGASNYSIFLDKETSKLFGYVEVQDEEKWSKLAKSKVNQKWWDFMKDVMETHADNSPVSDDLVEVFHMD